MSKNKIENKNSTKAIEENENSKSDNEIICENKVSSEEKDVNEESKTEILQSKDENSLIQEINNNVTPVQENSTIEEEQNNQEVDFTKKHTKIWIMGIMMVILLILIMFFSTIFAIININSEKIISGVSVNKIDVSGLTKAQATSKIKEKIEEKLNCELKLFKGDYKVNFNPQEIDVDYKVENAIETAYSIGRKGKVLKDNFEIINTYFSKENIELEYSYSEDKLSQIISVTLESMPKKLQESGYYIEDNNLIISKGNEGYIINNDELKKRIAKSIKNIENKNTYIEIPTDLEQPKALDINKIHDEIYKEPKNAYYTKEPFIVYPHSDGIDFNISLEEAQNVLASQDNQIIIPLKVIQPQITTNQIGTEAFPDLLATYSTTFSTRNSNRTTNIKLASNKINGVVLLPGEEFSYNKVVGKRTAAAGYKTAAVYVGGKVENGIGGGICQVSSTLYNSALRANLQIIKRSNHRFATGYVPLSTDATVSWGGPEFIFKNSRKYPIKIVSIINGGRITVQIFGCKEDVEYDVEIKSETLQKIHGKTTYRINEALPKGTTKKVQSGHGGYKSRAYRILKLNGQVISKELLSNDTYAQLETIIEHNP